MSLFGAGNTQVPTFQKPSLNHICQVPLPCAATDSQFWGSGRGRLWGRGASSHGPQRIICCSRCPGDHVRSFPAHCPELPRSWVSGWGFAVPFSTHAFSARRRRRRAGRKGSAQPAPSILCTTSQAGPGPRACMAWLPQSRFQWPGDGMPKGQGGGFRQTEDSLGPSGRGQDQWERSAKA